MKRIGLLSDTHGYWDDRYLSFFADCDEIWHAGDIGTAEVYEKLLESKPVRAVFGNADGQYFRQRIKQDAIFKIENVKVLITHIGGYPDKYAPGIADKLRTNKIKLFISGHSHILKVKYDPKFDVIHINPGAAGRQGFQLVRTLVRFTIDRDKVKDLEIMEIPLT
ncbi:MAG TPA: metallophosphoesterase family protein [Candidatus Enterocola sp.]|nr:metallophosphoesterase family protein [Candidatus Enterocola sp.]